MIEWTESNKVSQFLSVSPCILITIVSFCHNILSASCDLFPYYFTMLLSEESMHEFTFFLYIMFLYCTPDECLVLFMENDAIIKVLEMLYLLFAFV
jgi:hypothetical protein